MEYLFLLATIPFFLPESQSSPPYRCASSTYPPQNSGSSKAGWFDVNLDEKPEKRWIHVIKEFTTELGALNSVLPKLLARSIEPYLDKSMTLKDFYSLAFQALPTETQAELTGD